MKKIVRWFSIAPAAAMLLVGAASAGPSVGAMLPSESLYFYAIEGSADGGPIAAELKGADRFEAAWQLHVEDPTQLYFSSDSTAYYRSEGMWHAVLPSGDRISAVDRSNGTAYEGSLKQRLLAEDSAVSLSSSGGSELLWTYRLPEPKRIDKATLQSDELGNTYFQDEQGYWYSLNAEGRERYILEWRQKGVKALCKAAPSGDSVCASSSFGILGIREQNNAPRIMVDGRERFFPQKAQIQDGSTFVPMRALFEALGAKVEWDAATRTVEAEKQGRSVRLTIDSLEAEIDGESTALRQAPYLSEGVTYIPLRLAGEALGAAVVWEQHTRTIQIALP
ncbi:copper amine oxidase N-terminal domain-containing protein [Paenibacillus turpanensis]|uniref:copper amine oxidase N-terminal domain-containing protein n=1 Tax=Paenibacillus turpanensis TaxID=2689078 RepID=UPI00140D72A9|nr:copper amine oxidase N-terminal domain-containing protein [Paenibacillus turpanensis]